MLWLINKSQIEALNIRKLIDTASHSPNGEDPFPPSNQVDSLAALFYIAWIYIAWIYIAWIVYIAWIEVLVETGAGRTKPSPQLFTC